MSAEQVAPFLSAPSAARSGCRSTMTAGAPTLDTEDDIVFYCPNCAEREFATGG